MGLKRKFLDLKKKIVDIKEKYHPPTNYRRAMNIDPKDWGFKEFLFIGLFFFFGLMVMTRVYDGIMKSSNPSLYLNRAIIFMVIILILVIVYRILKGRNPLIPYYKKP